MEPDITAISSSPVTDAQGRPVADEPARAGRTGTSFATSLGTAGSHALTSRTAFPNGHKNGHGAPPADVHTRAHRSIEPLAAPWRALAGP
ncbi:MAG: hypothetical protein ACRDH5_01210, partial [bacterium]